MNDIRTKNKNHKRHYRGKPGDGYMCTYAHICRLFCKSFRRLSSIAARIFCGLGAVGRGPCGVARCRAVPLNPIFWPRVPKPCFPAPGPSKQFGDVFDWVCGVCWSSSNAELAKTIVHSIGFKFFISYNLRVCFCQPFAENTCSNKKKQSKPKYWNYIEFQWMSYLREF